MSGRDDLDSTTISRDETAYDDFSDFDLKGKRIGVIAEIWDDKFGG